MDQLVWIENRLQGLFFPQLLQIKDISEAHKGHAAYREGVTTHLYIRMQAACFAGKAPLERHRMVHRAIGEAFTRGLHALSLDLREAETASPDAQAASTMAKDKQPPQQH